MCNCTCRVVLFIVNIVVGLAGFLLMLAGALLTWGRSVIEEQFRGIVKQAIITLYEQQTATELTKLVEQVLRITAPFGLAIFCFGSVVFLICLFGCCGACCESNLCLKVYLGVVIFTVLLEIAALAFYYSRRDLVFKVGKRILLHSLVHYRSLESRDPNSMLFNVMMPLFQCCGVQNGSDFDRAKEFIRQANTSDGMVDIAYPVTCCKMSSSFEILDDTCPSQFNSNNSNIDRGCWQQIYPHLVYYGNVFAIAGIVVLLFQVLIIVMCIVTLALKQL